MATTEILLGVGSLVAIASCAIACTKLLAPYFTKNKNDDTNKKINELITLTHDCNDQKQQLNTANEVNIAIEAALKTTGEGLEAISIAQQREIDALKKEILALGITAYEPPKQTNVVQALEQASINQSAPLELQQLGNSQSTTQAPTPTTISSTPDSGFNSYLNLIYRPAESISSLISRLRKANDERRELLEENQQLQASIIANLDEAQAIISNHQCNRRNY